VLFNATGAAQVLRIRKMDAGEVGRSALFGGPLSLEDRVYHSGKWESFLLAL
jgi:hypothetical protein